MKRLFPVVLLLTACNSGILERDDRILYSAPAMVVSSVRYFAADEQGICTQGDPVPSDSSASHAIDLDHDGTDDFRITAIHERNTGYCGICTHHSYATYISALHNDARIAAAAEDDPAPKLFGAGEAVYKKELWVEKATLFISDCGTNYRPVPGGGAYLGLQLGKRYAYMFVTITDTGFEVAEYALNDRKKKDIECGARE